MVGRRFLLYALILILTIIAAGFGCTRGESDDIHPVDTWENPGGEGPEILFKPHTEPPFMPWPNDIATRKDETTLTGLRINVDAGGATDLNRRLRRNIRQLDGFGTNQSITVTFATPIDIATVSNENCFIINVQKGSPRYGEFHPIDFEYELLPIKLQNPEAFYPNDKMADAKDIQFKPGNRFKWYEDETNTLILRPLIPLQQSSEYAVVLMRDITDEEGRPIRPPDYFEYITFPSQLEPAERAVDIVRDIKDVSAADVAFVWSFTTQSISQPLEALRAGLNGEGQFDYLSSEFPPYLTVIDKFGTETDDEPDDYLLGAGFWINIFNLIGPLADQPGALPLDQMINMDSVDYIVAGTYTTPYFLGNDEGYFHYDWLTGEAEYGEEEVTFFFTIPRPTEENGYAQPPYPVTIFQHANVRNRLDSLALCSAMAKKGIATIGIDAAEHGPETYLWAVYAAVYGLIPVPDGLAEIGLDTVLKLLCKYMYPSWDIKGKDTKELADMLFAPGTFLGTALKGRSKDENGDGIIEGGNSFYSADIFRTKAITMQTLVDLFQLVRVLKNLGTDWNNDGFLSREEGDFNLDGVPDAGGPDNMIRFAGMSLGSIIGSSFIALEPEIHEAVLNVPGGILTDILQRNKIPNVNDAIRQDLMGPVVSGTPVKSGDTHLALNLAKAENYFEIIGTHPGERVVFRNLDSDEIRTKRIDDDGKFAISLAADKGDWMQLTVVNDAGDILEKVEWVQEFRGLGVERNTPVARNFVETAQWGVDGIDPINFAPFWVKYPLSGNEPKKVLIQLCMPDNAVPTSAGIALARAADFISMDKQIELKEMGIFDFGYSLYTEANLPYFSFSDDAVRIHPGGHHEYMLAPRPMENAVMYSYVAKAQAGIFFDTHGAVIADNEKALVPEEYYVPGY